MCMCRTDERSDPTLSGNKDRVPVYRVVDTTELAYLLMAGNYGTNPSRSGKYFALMVAGARAFAAAPMNAGSTITATSLPQSVVAQGFAVRDPGPYGAGPSIFFAEHQLPIVYAAITPPVVIGGGGLP